MVIAWVLFAQLLCITIKVCAQNTESFTSTTEDGDDIDDRGFLVPHALDSNVDKFTRGDYEYLFIDFKVRFKEAREVCKIYYAYMSVVREENVAHFAAEALAETNLIMDSVWIGGVRSADEKNHSVWYWEYQNALLEIDQQLVKTFVENPNVRATDRNCLSYSRADHDIPLFQPLTCNARRGVLCQRSRGGGKDSNSTHPGWIRLGKRLYKIFSPFLSYDHAEVSCYRADLDADLAVITNFDHCQKLGRYLLIGRPSLENAWIGAKYYDGAYRFEEENIVLANKVDKDGFPPWRHGKTQKHAGCILLDRHLTNFTVFLESRCERLRPFICYKIEANESYPFSDVIIGKFGYRLHYDQMSWIESINFCKENYKSYSAKLVEIDNKIHVYNLLYVMGENRTAVQHIWIGGKYFRKKGWIWNSNNSSIPRDDSLLNWVDNTTYTKSVEEVNTCLDMDRENHLVPLHYGTSCSFRQSFVCVFSAADLLRLQEDERKQHHLDD